MGHEFDAANPGNAGFPATRWTLIHDLCTGDEGSSGRALEELCRLYWYPVFAFVRRQGAGPEDAQDLTQGFFERLLRQEGFKLADQAKGKLRTFILSSVKHYVVQAWRRRTAEKRGGKWAPVSLEDSEERYALEPTHLQTPDELFDRRWALDALGEAMQRLEREYQNSGKSDLYTALQPYISQRPQGATYAGLGPRLKLSAGALQVAVHRLRQRFRDSLEAVVAETVAAPEDLPDELRYVVTMLTV